MFISILFCSQKYSGRYVIAKKLPLETGQNAFALLNALLISKTTTGVSSNVWQIFGDEIVWQILSSKFHLLIS